MLTPADRFVSVTRSLAAVSDLRQAMDCYKADAGLFCCLANAYLRWKPTTLTRAEVSVCLTLTPAAYMPTRGRTFTGTSVDCLCTYTYTLVRVRVRDVVAWPLFLAFINLSRMV